MPQKIPGKNQTKERRTVDGAFQVAIEKREDGTEKRQIVGHAAIFNVVDGTKYFRERIMPGAFAESIEKDDIRACLNHDANFILGRNKAGTLRLKEDEHGLHMEIDAPETQVGKDLLISINRGDISQASFSFLAIKDSWSKIDGQEVRTLEKVRLYDVSPVTYPFYEGTDVALRTRMDEQEGKRKTNMNLRKKHINNLRRYNYPV